MEGGEIGPERKGSEKYMKRGMREREGKEGREGREGKEGR